MYQIVAKKVQNHKYTINVKSPEVQLQLECIYKNYKVDIDILSQLNQETIKVLNVFFTDDIFTS